VLKYATDAQNETFEKLKLVFGDSDIKFTLIGAAACREYGMPRLTNDLDIVIVPYPKAMIALSRSGEFVVVEDDHPDPTNRTCTQRHTPTAVQVDFLTGGIRINNRCIVEGGIVHDAIPIPYPTGFGDVLPLAELIALKISAAISGRTSQSLGTRIRSLEKIEQDDVDVGALISICRLGRDLRLGHPIVERRYREIYDSQ
jgi:hypothetical protein